MSLEYKLKKLADKQTKHGGERIVKIYMWNADLYCKPCGEAIAATLPEPTEWEHEHSDSNDYPVEYDSSEGESDTPDHCGECNLFLERNLTEDGVRYVRELASDYIESSNELSETVQQWVDFYDIEVEVTA